MTHQVPDRLYIIVDQALPVGAAAAQIAHVAVAAANHYEVTDETYVVVLTTDVIEFMYTLRRDHNFHDFVCFKEPDLGNAITTIASLNPRLKTFSKLRLFGGGESNGN